MEKIETEGELKNKKKNRLVGHISDLWELLTYNKAALVVLIATVIIGAFMFKIDTPRNFTPGLILTIEDGSSVKQVADILYENNIIKSPTIFNIYVQLKGDSIVFSGDYLFDEKQTVFEVANRIMNSKYGIPIIQVTITEGMTVREIAERMESRFPKFNTSNFLNLASVYEGYLFPDTYRFSMNVNEVQVIETMRENFNNRISAVKDDILKSGRTLNDIITMASIVEKEATRDTIQEVSDVLWNRIEVGMLLQVDATFVYSIGKNSFTVTRAEMQDETDLYNTYVHIGLPPTPISNPGMAAIMASIYSNPTDYLFFLTGRDGEMYFARNFEEHIINRRRYLD